MVYCTVYYFSCFIYWNKTKSLPPRLFQAPQLEIEPKFPTATFIPGATIIQYFRVDFNITKS